MATEQFVSQKDNLTFKAGTAALKPNRYCHVVPATGVVDYAFAEANVNCISLSYGERVGDPVTCKMLPYHNESVDIEVGEAGSRGDIVYLDIQSTQGAATGLGIFTAGAAVIPMGYANNTIVGATTSAPIKCPVYRTTITENAAETLLAAAITALADRVTALE
jgi:hypothetical protein